MTVLFTLSLVSALSMVPQEAATLPTHTDSAARIIDRLPLSKAKFSMVNEKEEAALLLLEHSIVLQMTDRGLQKLSRDMSRETAEKPSFVKTVLGAVLAGTIFTMLDHGIEYSLTDLKEARVEKGVLVLESKSGGRIFESVNLNNDKVLTTFSEAEARRFAKRVNEAKKHHH